MFLIIVRVVIGDSNRSRRQFTFDHRAACSVPFGGFGQFLRNPEVTLELFAVRTVARYVSILRVTFVPRLVSPRSARICHDRDINLREFTELAGTESWKLNRQLGWMR